MSKFILTVVLFCSLYPLGLCAQTLRVGLSADYQPLHYRHEDRVVGIEPDNAVSVGKILGRDTELVVLPFDRLIPALLAGDIDVIMSGLSVTAARSEQIMFAEPYLQVGQMAIMHKDKVGRFSQPWAVYREGIRVGIEPGTTGEAFAMRELKDAVISRYDDPPAAFEALRKNKIDLYVHDAPTSWQLANSDENQDLISLYAPLTEEQLAWAVRPGQHDLLQDLNQALRAMQSSGTLSYILNRWIPVRIEVQP